MNVNTKESLIKFVKVIRNGNKDMDGYPLDLALEDACCDLIVDLQNEDEVKGEGE